MDDDLAEQLRRSVRALSWRFARTMPAIPHWYIVRSPANEAAYAALFSAVHTHGVMMRFGRARRKYLELGDGYKYWPMTTNIEISKIINRCVVGREFRVSNVSAEWRAFKAERDDPALDPCVICGIRHAWAAAPPFCTEVEAFEARRANR